MAAERFADAFGLLPGAFIRNDPLFASVFMANLGSLKMDSAYHHLYEYGSVSIFCTVGRMHPAPVVAGEGLVVRQALTLKFTYDERIEDGMYAHAGLQRLKAIVEDPEPVMGSRADSAL